MSIALVDDLWLSVRQWTWRVIALTVADLRDEKTSETGQKHLNGGNIDHYGDLEQTALDEEPALKLAGCWQPIDCLPNHNRNHSHYTESCQQTANRMQTLDCQ
ncbi:MAG: hypothetical protein HON53_22825 [Planctomycetaceae bacterium]|nr:hypothetical protein [Planctomycetaceae bacterium]MBT6157016.1 hypothetical protein [Planctomycetaceae bacterium]MBT6484418.1 hypothetical protein [Planctomycetaceae bacterium]MBT6494659.1 hypothetical protein [Planctomycetaceae bacterium]